MQKEDFEQVIFCTFTGTLYIRPAAKEPPQVMSQVEEQPHALNKPISNT